MGGGRVMRLDKILLGFWLGPGIFLSILLTFIFPNFHFSGPNDGGFMGLWFFVTVALIFAGLFLAGLIVFTMMMIDGIRGR